MASHLYSTRIFGQSVDIGPPNFTQHTGRTNSTNQRSTQPTIHPFNVLNPHQPLSLLWPYLVSNPTLIPSRAQEENIAPNTHHFRIELYRPCKPSRNLLTCPDFSASQPHGPASIPHLHSLPCCTPQWDCPRCGDSEPDLRYKRLCKFRAAGVKVGRDASREGTGLELGVGCCGVM